MGEPAKGESKPRPESDAFEAVFARICLQRGWVTRDEIAVCLKERGASGAALADLLIARNHISRPQGEVVREEVARRLQTEAYATVQQEAPLGDLLIRTGKVKREQVYEALAVQSQCVREKMLVPLLGDLLVEKGWLSRPDLEEALRIQRGMKRLRCESCGTDYLVAEFDPARIYLCRKCAQHLTLPPVGPVSPSADPEEAVRSAQNSKNVVGRYVVVKELGRGGMGAVYKAWDTVVKRWVALKIHTVAGGVDGLIRFRREAETAASLQHPDIVPIFDVGQSGDRHFIAMKYIEGQPVGQKWPVRQACEIMARVARAIQLAHSRDIVHRDLKPGNILVDPSGHPYVMDFGLAKNLFESFNITAPGTIMGSPSYMSPEQASGQNSKVDQRSDIYGLGAVLYAMLTGHPPFKGETAILTIKQVIDQPVISPRVLNPEIPPDLEKIVLRALSKDKAARHAAVGEFAGDLERFIAGKPSEPASAAPPAAAKKRRRWFWFS